jgi:PadR family transcriptional regulator, regulatory protein PadR
MSASREQKPVRAKAADAARKAAAEAHRAAEESGFAPAGRPSDVFGADLPYRAQGGALRRRDIFTLLVLHLIGGSEGGDAYYGNRLIDRIEEITGGSVSLNPNTMYPLLRDLEADGLVAGRWEHPEKRSRRLYTLTAEGRAECDRLKQCLEPFLDSIIDSISLIKREIYG